jgi:hypothetical protein
MSAISDGLQFGAAAVAVIGASVTAEAYTRRRWKHTVGRRHTQTAILDELTYDISLEYIESNLGPPLFITYPDGHEERLYRLSGAWVTVQPLNGAVIHGRDDPNHPHTPSRSSTCSTPGKPTTLPSATLARALTSGRS